MKGKAMDNYTSLTDEQLVTLCRKNNSNAWSELCSRYIALSRSLCFKFSGQSVEAEDLVQEGLIGFFSAVHTFSPNGAANFKTYACSCMRNKIINAVKAARTKKQIPTELNISLETDMQLADTALSPEELVVSKNVSDAIMKAVNELLSEKESEVFKLYLSGVSYEQIAAKLSISKKSVDGALQRARKKLKELIASDEFES